MLQQAVGNGGERNPSARGAPREFLTFRLGAEEYGIAILKVQEIRGWEQPTSIAGAPDFIKGVINLRGTIIPIVDRCIKFGLGEATGSQLVDEAGKTMDEVVTSVKRVTDIMAEISAASLEQRWGAAARTTWCCLTMARWLIGIVPRWRYCSNRRRNAWAAMRWA